MKLFTRTRLLTLVLCAVIQLQTTFGYKILSLFFHPGKSHFDFFRPLLRGLAGLGHDVAVVSYFPNEEPIDNYTDLLLTGMPDVADSIDLKMFEGDFSLIPFKLPMFFKLHEWGMISCDVAFNSKIIKDILMIKDRYDIILVELFNNDCVMAVTHILQAPVIALSSCSIMPWQYSRMGTPFIPSFMPVNFLPHSDDMGFVERINNFVHFYALNFLYSYFTQTETNALIKKHFGPSFPSVALLVQNLTAMFINQHFTITGAKPYPPSVVELGGMQIDEGDPLDLELQNFLDGATEGAVYMSWGSMIRPETISPEKLNAILKAVQRFPRLTFLMKWANVSLPNQPKNVYTRKWMPQKNILCHPNVKIFMTHGGLLGASEAVYCGVPMMLTPIYGDQFVNSAAIVRRNAGIVVNYKDLREESIVGALKNLLNPSFQKTANYIAEAYKNRPEKPLDLAIWWVEHIIQTNGVPLTDSVSSNMHWFIYQSLDVYTFFGVMALFLISSLKFVVQCLSKVSRKISTNKLPNKQKKH